MTDRFTASVFGAIGCEDSVSVFTGRFVAEFGNALAALGVAPSPIFIDAIAHGTVEGLEFFARINARNVNPIVGNDFRVVDYFNGLGSSGAKVGYRRVSRGRQGGL